MADVASVATLNSDVEGLAAVVVAEMACALC